MTVTLCVAVCAYVFDCVVISVLWKCKCATMCACVFDCVTLCARDRVCGRVGIGLSNCVCRRDKLESVGN